MWASSRTEPPDDPAAESNRRLQPVYEWCGPTWPNEEKVFVWTCQQEVLEIFDVVHHWLCPYQCLHHFPRGLSEGSGSLSYFITELGESLIGNFCGRKRLCVREILSPVDVNDNQMPHVHVRMEGLRRRCKHCYVRGVKKEVVKGCAVCNIHMCSQCFLEKHWTHLTFPWCKTALWF